MTGSEQSAAYAERLLIFAFATVAVPTFLR